MDDGPSMNRLLWVWTGTELAGIAVFLLAVLFGYFDFPEHLGAAVILFLAVELMIPAAVYLDMRRRGDVEHTWIHVTAAPLLNVIGLVGYLAHRRSPPPSARPE